MFRSRGLQRGLDYQGACRQTTMAVNIETIDFQDRFYGIKFDHESPEEFQAI